MFFYQHTFYWSGNTNLDEFDELNMSCVTFSWLILAPWLPGLLSECSPTNAQHLQRSGACETLRDTARRQSPAANRSFATLRRMRRQPIACICFLIFPSLTHMSQILSSSDSQDTSRPCCISRKVWNYQLVQRPEPETWPERNASSKAIKGENLALWGFEGLLQTWLWSLLHAVAGFLDATLALWQNGCCWQSRLQIFQGPDKAQPTARRDHHGHMVTSHGR